MEKRETTFEIKQSEDYSNKIKKDKEGKKREKRNRIAVSSCPSQPVSCLVKSSPGHAEERRIRL